MSIPISQFIPPSLSPLVTHKFVFYVCESVSVHHEMFWHEFWQTPTIPRLAKVVMLYTFLSANQVKNALLGAAAEMMREDPIRFNISGK